jgi:hypothetical protein
VNAVKWSQSAGNRSDRSSGTIALNVLSRAAVTAAPAMRRAPASVGSSGAAVLPLMASNKPSTIA